MDYLPLPLSISPYQLDTISFNLYTIKIELFLEGLIKLSLILWQLLTLNTPVMNAIHVNQVLMHQMLKVPTAHNALPIPTLLTKEPPTAVHVQMDTTPYLVAPTAPSSLNVLKMITTTFMVHATMTSRLMLQEGNTILFGRILTFVTLMFFLKHRL